MYTGEPLLTDPIGGSTIRLDNRMAGYRKAKITGHIGFGRVYWRSEK